MDTKAKGRVLDFLKENRSLAGFCAVLAALIGCGLGWYYSRPRFHDLTVELGTESISIEDFWTGFGDAINMGIVTDLSTIDIGSAGSTSLVLRNGFREETVTLTVVDTTPPEVEFISRLEKTPDYKPDPNDFIVSCHDLAPVTVSFVGNAAIPLNYEDQSLTVVVEDASGNITSQECTLSIVWLKSEYTLELGEVLESDDLLYNPGRDACMIQQEDIDTINASGIGEYTVSSLVDENVCHVTVEDTTPPELVLTDISAYVGEAVTLDRFVVSCFDASGDPEIRFVTEPSVDTLGEQTITIEGSELFSIMF